MSGILRMAAAILTVSTVTQVLMAGSATAQTALLEVDKGEDNLMRVTDDGAFVVTGRENVGGIPTTGPGSRLMWYPRKYAFRAGAIAAGEWDDANIGVGSVAMGYSTTASGEWSTALGSQTTASGAGSTAIGFATAASGHRSTAMGLNTVASGAGATAMGQQSTASGLRATAMGFNTTASGEAATAMGQRTIARGTISTAIGSNTEALGIESIAMGSDTKAIGLRSIAMGFRLTAAGDGSTVMGSDAGTLPGATGSFVYGDGSSAADLVSFTPNEFVVRAAGGFRFRTSSTLNTGCDLPPGSGTFNCTSSRLAKESFEDIDGEIVLGELAKMQIQRWRYRGTRALHVGPTAEDFHAAFGLGQGPTTLSTVDASGISLLAVQALERRVAALQAELEALRRIVEGGRIQP